MAGNACGFWQGVIPRGRGGTEIKITSTKSACAGRPRGTANGQQMSYVFGAATPSCAGVRVVRSSDYFKAGVLSSRPRKMIPQRSPPDGPNRLNVNEALRLVFGSSVAK